MSFNLLLAVALVAVLANLGGPVTPQSSPYLSALTSSFAAPAFAAKGCEYKDCAGGSRHNIVCASVAFPAINCFTYHGYCLTNTCP